MKLSDLTALLNSLGYPVAHSHFKSTSESPAPSPPFITYTTPSDEDLKADNTNYHKIIDVDIEVYTNKKDLKIEGAVEQMLDENELPYKAYQVYIDQEELFQKTYEVRLI